MSAFIKKLFWLIASRSRVDTQGNPKGPRLLVGESLKRLFERNPRGMATALFRAVSPMSSSHDYATTTHPPPEDQFTASRMVGKPELLLFVISQFDIDPSRLSWLEIGCCDCANLFTLRKMGFHDLSGVEINNEFLAAGQRYDGVAFSEIHSYCDSIEHYAATCKSQYDVLFSCAVMQHINPLMNTTFSDLANMSKTYIVSVEAEDQCNPIHFARNYQRVFERLGFQQIRSALIQRDSYQNVDGRIVGYTVRIFKRSKPICVQQ